MSDQSFGAKKIELIGSSGVPNVTSPTNLNLNANTVAISTDVTIGGKVQSDVIVGTGYSVGIGSTQPTESLDVAENLAVKGSVRLVGVNTSLAGTAGTTGDIKMFHGAPFIHDGTAWREFYLKEGVPVTESADTEWDNVIFRNTFDSSFTEVKFSAANATSSNADLVASPRKFGEKALRIQDGYVRYNHRSEYIFEGAWTIEGWFYWDAIPTSSGSSSDVLISKSSASTNNNAWSIIAENSTNTGYTNFRWWNYETHGTGNYSGSGIGSVTELSIFRTWNHIAVTRESTDGSIHFWFNGVESELTSSNQVIDNNIIDDEDNRLNICDDAIVTGRAFDGIIDDLRISTVARYISTEGSFTPPTEALPVTGTLSGPVDPPYFSAITEIAELSDVNGATPSNGQVLKWNGTQWAPASDLVGVGTTGVGIGLSDLSVSTNPVGTNALSYDDTTGTFTFTPTSLVGYATEGYVDNAVAGIATTGYVDNAIVGFITAGASGAGLTALTGAPAGTYGDNGNSAQIIVDANGRITSITQVAITTDGAGVNVSGVSTFNDNVSFGSTILVDGAVRLTGINTTIVGTSGTTGDIKMIGGAPFFYDGSSWREFALATGTPVTVAEDTEWDNVIFRVDFDTNTTDYKFSQSPQTQSATLVTSPVKYGAQALRVEDQQCRYPNRSEYDFTGEWTIEGWFYWDAIPTSSGSSSDALWSSAYTSSNNDTIAILAENSANAGYTDFRWYNKEKHGTSYSGSGIGSVTEASIFRTWNHIAVVREPLDGSIHFYFNGVESELTSSNQVVDNNIQYNSNHTLNLGSVPPVGQVFDGIIDDFRISTVARYTENFTPPTQALPTSGTLSSVVDPPGDKYGEIGLGTSPTWTGTSGVTVSQQGQGEYRLTFTSSYTNADDYFVLTQPMDQGFAAYVGAARSTTHVDFTINRQSNDAAIDTNSLAVQITNHA